MYIISLRLFVEIVLSAQHPDRVLSFEQEFESIWRDLADVGLAAKLRELFHAHPDTTEGFEFWK